MNYWICDTETTGLYNAGAVEMALIQIDEQLNILRQYESLTNPGIPIEPGATEIHGITDADIAEAPSPEQFVQEMIDDGADFSDVCFIAHNSKFDLKFYRPFLGVRVDMCTLAMARRSIRGSPNYKLATLVEFLGLPQRQAHSAMGDCLSVHDLLCRLVADSGRPFTTYVGLAQKPQMVHIMSFGKYQGRSIMSIPRSYRQYMLNNFELDNDMRYTLETLAKTGV